MDIKYVVMIVKFVIPIYVMIVHAYVLIMKTRNAQDGGLLLRVFGGMKFPILRKKTPFRHYTKTAAPAASTAATKEPPWRAAALTV